MNLKNNPVWRASIFPVLCSACGLLIGLCFAPIKNGAGLLAEPPPLEQYLGEIAVITNGDGALQIAGRQKHGSAVNVWITNQIVFTNHADAAQRVDEIRLRLVLQHELLRSLYNELRNGGKK